MQSIHTSLNGLINKLFTKYGADKARSIMSTTYGQNMTEQEMMTCINIDNQNKADHPASVEDAQHKHMQMEVLHSLREIWVRLNKEYKAMDKRTTSAKLMAMRLESLVERGNAVKGAQHA